MTWSTEVTDELIRLWSTGLSASKIAEELGDGITRNSVIGKLNRMKLGERLAGYEVEAYARRIAREADERRKCEARDVRDIAGKPDRAPLSRWHVKGHVLSVKALNAMEREPTKRQLRDVLAEAMRNTAVLQNLGAS